MIKGLIHQEDITFINIYASNREMPRYIKQVLMDGALGRPRGMEWGGRREEGSGWGTHVNLWRIHFDIWQI